MKNKKDNRNYIAHCPLKTTMNDNILNASLPDKVVTNCSTHSNNLIDKAILKPLTHMCGHLKIYSMVTKFWLPVKLTHPKTPSPILSLE